MKNFKNPMFLVDVKGNAIGVDFFPVSEKKLDENGQLVDNPNFKSLKTVLENYIPKNNAKDGEVPTRVKIDGILSANEYVNKDTYEFKSITQVNGFRITSTGVPEEDSADCEISGIIRSIV